MTGLLNTNAAAEKLGIKAKTLNTWRSTKKVRVPFIKIGRSVFYDPEDLDHFIVQNKKDLIIT